MNTTLAERVTERMEAMRLSNAKLAKAAKVKPPTAFNWACGKTKNIKGEPLLLAAIALGVTPGWLATGMGKKFPDTSEQKHSVQEENVAYFEKPGTLLYPWPFGEAVTHQQYSLLSPEEKREIEHFIQFKIAAREPPSKQKAPARIVNG